MAIKIDRAMLTSLMATIQTLTKAVDELTKLDDIEGRPKYDLQWIKIVKDRGSWDNSSFDDEEKLLVQAMKGAAQRRAHERGRELRAEAIEKSIGTIETLRAVLCSQAASATIELARIVRDARERG